MYLGFKQVFTFQQFFLKLVTNHKIDESKWRIFEWTPYNFETNDRKIKHWLKNVWKNMFVSVFFKFLYMWLMLTIELEIIFVYFFFSPVAKLYIEPHL